MMANGVVSMSRYMISGHKAGVLLHKDEVHEKEFVHLTSSCGFGIDRRNPALGRLAPFFSTEPGQA